MEIESRWIPYGLMVLPIASVHAWFPWFAIRFQRSEDRWVGFIGGIALGYAVLYMLPKIGAANMVARIPSDEGSLLKVHAFPFLLLGIVLYVLIDRLNQSSASRARTTSRGLEYGIHGFYALLVGFIVVEMPSRHLLAHALAMLILALHTIGMSDVLRHHHADNYPRFRWVLMVLVLAGGLTGLLTEIPSLAVSMAVGFTGGVILVNVLATELPVGQKDRFGWFLLGILAFIGLGLVVATA